MDVGERIKKYREKQNLSQDELALKIFVSRQTISNWENNNVPPSIDTLLRIARFFDVSTDYLLEFSNERKISTNGLTDTQIAHIQAIIQDIVKTNP